MSKNSPAIVAAKRAGIYLAGASIALIIYALAISEPALAIVAQVR